MKRIVLILVFLTLNLNSAQLNIKFDCAVFRNDSINNLLELYFSFPSNSIRYISDSTGFRGQLDIELDIIKDGKTIESINSKFPVVTLEVIRNEPYDLLGIKVIKVPVGKFDLTVKATDANAKENIIEKNFSFGHKNHFAPKISISDIQIASKIETESKKSYPWDPSFKKNSLYVIPNPGAEIVSSHPAVNSYIEIYNSQKLDGDSIKVTYSVKDATLNEVFSYPRLRKANKEGLVESISLPIEALSTGVYYLKILVEKSNHDYDSVSAMKKFYVWNTDIPAKPLEKFFESISFEQSEFATLTEEQVNIAFEQVKVIASNYDKDLFEKCTTLDAKQRFMYAFWKNRNTDTVQTYNVELEKYRELIDFANKNFKYGLFVDGWRTSRGKVLLKYGHPTNIDKIVQVSDKLPYEKWYFDEIQGGAEFYFVDFTGYGNFVLVHSTAVGEIKNPNWYEQYILKKDPDKDFQYR